MLINMLGVELGNLLRFLLANMLGSMLGNMSASFASPKCLFITINSLGADSA